MYGVPEDLDLAPFIGTTLDYIGIGKYEINFVFSGDPHEKDRIVNVGGYWEMRDAQSVLIDKAVEPDERNDYKIHKLLSKTVTDTKVKPPESFSFVFDNGWTLTFVDDSEHYESCHISVGDREIYI
ncbi:MAG: hypothetical protein IT426_08800 [Pirellulales bacterium]|nr:hypothetical protein [Pirellulales bacterium]